MTALATAVVIATTVLFVALVARDLGVRWLADRADARAKKEHELEERLRAVERRVAEHHALVQGPLKRAVRA